MAWELVKTQGGFIKWVLKPTVLGAGNSSTPANPHEWEDSNCEAFGANDSASESGHAHFARRRSDAGLFLVIGTGEIGCLAGIFFGKPILILTDIESRTEGLESWSEGLL